MQDRKIKEKKNLFSGNSADYGKRSSTGEGRSGKNILDKIYSKIPTFGKGSNEVLYKAIIWVVYAYLSILISGGKLFFGATPLSFGLLSAVQVNLSAVFIGILISVLSGISDLSLLWGGLVIVILRVIVSFVPEFHEKSDSGSDYINADALGMRESTLQLDGEVAVSQWQKFRLRCLLPIAEVFARLFGVSDSEAKKSVFGVEIIGRYNESVGARALFASVGGFVCGLFRLIESDFAFYSMFGALFTIILSSLFALIFSRIGSGDGFTWRGSFAWFILLCACVYSGGEVSVLGIPAIPFSVMLFVLFITSVRGIFAGGFCGIIFGLIYNPLYAPLLCLCGILYGILSSLKKSFALGAVSFAIVLWCYYFGGTQGLVGVLVPMLIGVPIFVLTDKVYSALPGAKQRRKNFPFETRREGSEGIYFAEAVSERGKNEVMTDRLGALSDAFASMSETFNDLVDRFRRPDVLGIKKISEEVFEKNCKNCRNYDVCWGVGYSDTLEVVGKITSSLHLRGRVELSDLPDGFISSCPRAEKIIEEATAMCESVAESIIQNQKIGVFASNFDDISAILRDALDGEADEYECDMEAGEKIFNMLGDLKYKSRGVVVCGKRSLRVLIKGASADRESLSGGTLCEKISEIVGVQLLGPIFEMSNDETVMTFYSKPKLSAICSHGRLSAVKTAEGDLCDDDFYGEDCACDCGDCTRVFVNGHSYFYSLISDGMGSGAEAALASEISSMFVEKMLMAGNRADITVRMLNNFLRSENIGLGRECSATLDLFELDLMSGVASFIKSGAAPTYICRSGKVYKVNSRTMPVGIIKKADAKLTKFDTTPGDLVVMISDGCCPDSDDCPWLVEYLSELEIPDETRTPQASEEFTNCVKGTVLRLAVENMPSDKHADDVSVSVILICT